MIIRQILTLTFVVRRNERGPSTHPGYAALADPLFAFGGKKVEKIALFPACRREGGRAKQRPGELLPTQKPSFI